MYVPTPQPLLLPTLPASRRSSCPGRHYTGTPRWPAQRRWPDGMSSDQADTRYKALQRATRAYLEDMHVSPELLDLMNSIPPDQIKVLSTAEQQRYGLTDVDPIFDERQTADAAHTLGITSEELRRRGALADQKCGRVENCDNQPFFQRCFNQLMTCRDRALGYAPAQ